MKRIICFLLVLIMCLSCSVFAFADYATARENTTIMEIGNRAEETVWYYRITSDGLLQRRLWSITYGYWLTDWETIGFVDPE